MTASPGFGHLGPMLTAARTELAAAGMTEPPDVVVADAGYWAPRADERHHRPGHRGSHPTRLQPPKERQIGVDGRRL